MSKDLGTVWVWASGNAICCDLCRQIQMWPSYNNLHLFHRSNSLPLLDLGFCQKFCHDRKSCHWQRHLLPSRRLIFSWSDHWALVLSWSVPFKTNMWKVTKSKPRVKRVFHLLPFESVHINSTWCDKNWQLPSEMTDCFALQWYRRPSRICDYFAVDPLLSTFASLFWGRNLLLYNLPHRNLGSFIIIIIVFIVISAPRSGRSLGQGESGN